MQESVRYIDDRQNAVSRHKCVLYTSLFTQSVATKQEIK